MKRPTPILTLLLAAACGQRDVIDLERGATAYRGAGFIVHEWGTDTVVAGSDGSLQKGLHHEEEDLPKFVYDFRDVPSATAPEVEVKMETPVTYFYAEGPMRAEVRVGFPSGMLTQWYPGAAVQERRGREGELDWGEVEIGPRGAEVKDLPDAPLDVYTWAHARGAASNPIARTDPVTGAIERERFLFYRGLGTFEPPVRVRASDREVTLTNRGGAPAGHVFVLDVGTDGGAFVERASGVAADGQATLEIPAAGARRPKAEYADALGAAIQGALTGAGLYADEAAGMVATWRRQWFHTPGVRVLYLAPQAWTEASIPLAIDPKPDHTVRVMVIRVEVITPALESADISAARGLADARTEAGARDYFLALGRFAEPRLRRAWTLLGEPEWTSKLMGELTAQDFTSAGD